MKKLFLFSLITPLLFIPGVTKEGKGTKSIHHDRYTAILYSDEAGGCIPGGGGGPGGGGSGGGGGGPTDPPIPPVPPKANFFAGKKLGIIAFNRGQKHRKTKFHMRIKGVVGITGVDIHCRDIAGNDSGVGVTLKQTGWFDHGWEDATGYIKHPDKHNPCRWDNLNDMHDAVEKGDAFVRVKTLDNPDGELSGDLACIGFYNTDWY